MSRLIAALMGMAVASVPSFAAAVGVTPPGGSDALRRAVGDAGFAVAANAATPPATATPDAPALTGNPLWSVPLRLLGATRDKPIFSPSRRPPPPAVVNVQPVAKPPPPPPPSSKPQRPNFSLVGTIIGDDQSIAVFVEQGSNNIIRLRTGEAHQDWTLQSVQGRTVILQNGSQQETYELPKVALAPNVTL
jgi:hypothetical protein